MRLLRLPALLGHKALLDLRVRRVLLDLLDQRAPPAQLALPGLRVLPVRLARRGRLAPRELLARPLPLQAPLARQS